MTKPKLYSFFILIGLLVAPLYPCSEHNITPVFRYKHAPENPFENFAAGKIGILKPTYRRVVLYAAYRFLNNQGFSIDEQKALTDVWNAEFKNKEFRQTKPDEVVKRWLEKRKDVVKDEKSLPSVYIEREYGGYAYFPNCNADAFETAIETLSDRIDSYGVEGKDVAEWLKGQDAVFTNCAGGKKIPGELSTDSPVWLQKDRQYQIAAADFYSLDLEKAKDRFQQIALDPESVWQETADYLVGRTLIRQASFTKDETERKKLYEQAEDHFILMRGNKFYDSAQKLINLVKIRTRPKERTRELAQSLLFGQYGDGLRQNLIDYTWLLDKFETEALKAEEKRKKDEEIARFAEADRIMRDKITSGLAGIGVSVEVIILKGQVTLKGKIPAEKYEQVLSIAKSTNPAELIDNLTRVSVAADGTTFFQGLYDEPRSNWMTREQRDAIDRGEMFKIVVWIFEPEIAPGNQQPGGFGYGSGSSRTVVARLDESDDEIFERFWGKTRLSEDNIRRIKYYIKEARANHMRNKFESKPQPDYEGGYNGKEKIELPLIPDFLRGDDLTDWLFTFQTDGENAYRHALDKWLQNRSELWLTNALVKAHKDSKNIAYLLEKAAYVNQNSPAFPTVAYHRARVLIEQEKPAEAAKLLDEVLHSNLDLPVSSRNEFAEMRMKIAATLEEFLKNAVRRSFTFADYTTSVTIDEVIEDQKSWWGPGFGQPKAEWDRETEVQYAKFKLWENRLMFDGETVRIMNEQFPLPVLLEAQRSPALPDYIREKLARVIWTRAVILEDDAVLQKIAPEVMDFAPEAKEYLTAKSPLERRFAALYVIYRHDDFVPFVESGVNSGYEPTGEPNGWWCAVSEHSYDANWNQVPRIVPPRPAFLTAAQSNNARQEIKKLERSGGAPEYLAEKAKEWFKLAPKDQRLPEVLYQAGQANEALRYGCGNNLERDELLKLLSDRFPGSPWARKVNK